jgi:hypothetical protein
MGRMYRVLLNESSLLAYHDTFLFISAVTLCLSFVALLMPGNKPHGKSSSEEPVMAH